MYLVLQAFCSLLGCSDKIQIYSYRGVVQHHGIVVWTPPAELARELAVEELRLAVKVVHFDPSRDGVITTPLEVFLEVKLLTARYHLEGGPFCRVKRKKGLVSSAAKCL